MLSQQKPFIPNDSISQIYYQIISVKNYAVGG